MAEEAAPVSGAEEVTEPLETEDTETPEEETETSVQEDEDSGEESEETDSDEEPAEEVDAEGQEHKKDAQSRIQQLANEKRDLANKLDALESKVNQTLEQRNEIPAINEEALNAHLGQMREQIDDLRLEGNHLQADMLERKRNGLLDEYDKWQKGAEEKKQQNGQQQQYQQQLDGVLVAADKYQEHYNVPKPLWDEMGQWFRGEMEADKLLAQEFDDVMLRQGPVAAVRFAHDRAKPVFEAKAREATEAKKKREAAKGKQPGGGAGKTSSGPKSYSALLNLGSAALSAYKKSNPKHYQKLFDSHMK
jgi:predicted RNase H-like nuclease (RuvC/YqgF family)